MIRAIARYGVRSVPGDEQEIVAAFRRGEAVAGPAIAEFENRFAEYHGLKNAQSASYGRMAFFYLLRAFDFPPGSEIIFPALTFWVVPEMARQAGLTPVFVDVDPTTFNIDPAKIESAISDKTCAIVPTHLYGQPCAMTEVMRIAERNYLIVIEDCAQAAGAGYQGRKVGTFGDAAFFSFQLLKGINTYGGGMAVTNIETIADRVRELATSEPPPSTNDLIKKFAAGLIARSLVSPKGFTWWGFPIGTAASYFGDLDLSKYFWEKIRPLDAFPRTYRQRFSNVQAILGLRSLERLDQFNSKSREHADIYTRGLNGCESILTPRVIDEAEHVYYQYCVYVSEASRVKRGAIRRAVDFETTHVDVCSSLPLFSEYSANCPGAEKTEGALQLPVYSRLRTSDVERVLQVVRELTADLSPLAERAERNIATDGLAIAQGRSTSSS